MYEISNIEEALNILINAVLVGQKAGAYSLNDAVIIKAAIDYLVPEEERIENKPDESPENKSTDNKNVPEHKPEHIKPMENKTVEY